MTFDGVPWAVGNGAEMSTEVLRNLAYQATGGKEGVAALGDLKISAMATPAGQVRWAPGSVAILNRSPGGAQQTYVGRNPTGSTEVTNTIAATGTGGGRSDLIVVRVEDPQYSPWGAPASVAFGPYIFPRVISPVANTITDAAQLGLTHSQYAVARIDIPANTTAITNAMIVDLRKVAQPQRERLTRRINYVAVSTYSGGTFAQWPTGSDAQIPVPSWATKAVITVNVQGLYVSGSSAAGEFRAIFTQDSLPTQVTYWNFQTVSSQRYEVVIKDTVNIPAAARGTTRTLRTEARRTDGTGSINVDVAAQIIYDVEFYEQAV